jgi:hypothetical protein
MEDRPKIVDRWPVLGRWRRWRRAIRTIRARYRDYHGRPLSLYRPKRFTEKMQWRKLFDLDPAFATFSDKFASRDYIAGLVGPERLPELLWIGTDPDAIPFEQLEPPYVVKATHGYGQHAIVERDAIADVPALRAMARDWMGSSHGAEALEPGYIHVPHRIIVERLIERADGGPPLEHRVFVFGGKARIVQTGIVEAGTRDTVSTYHTTDWTRLDWRFKTFYDDFLPRPARLDEMLAAAETLAGKRDFLRVDIYDCGDDFRIGELTVYSWSGLIRYTPDSADEVLGAFWHVRLPWLRALSAIAFRRYEIRPKRR